jgi:3',5'-cyclic-AMP phosphodiesterase
MSDIIMDNQKDDGIDRRGFLKCMAWAGTGIVCTISGGVLGSRFLGQSAGAADLSAGPSVDFSFVQISDSHIGFNKEANKDVIGTFREAVARINALPQTPDFIIHTGDITHLADAAGFDVVEKILQECKVKQVFYCPGEHDVMEDDGAKYRERFGRDTLGLGWNSFDFKGVHFVGLVNVIGKKQGLGKLGDEQLAWLEKDLAKLSSETPVVAYAHVPLWMVSPEWGWGTDDGSRALEMLKRFGSVSVLNGHVHQTMQKIEGNLAFHSAMSTAFPQPAPGSAPKAGPMIVPANKLRSLLGLKSVNYIANNHSLAVVDSSLAEAPKA